MASPTPLPAPRLVVTAHDSKGTSYFSADGPNPIFSPFGPSVSSFSNFSADPSIPVSNAGLSPSPQNLQAIPRCPPQGVSFGTTDIPPNFTVPMHRTLSADYAVVVSGEIVWRLDNGEEKVVRAGEFMIQRGTNHQWINRGSEHCRIAFVMVGAEMITLEDGTKLEETVIKPPVAK